MATKKKTEVEESAVVEEAVEETPKKTTKKSTSTKKKAEPKTEEVVEEVKAEEPAPVVEEVKEEPKKVEKKAEKKEEPKKEEPKKEAVATKYTVQVISATGVYSFKGPGLNYPKVSVYANGSKLEVTETKGNWGKVGENKWIIIGGAVIKI